MNHFRIYLPQITTEILGIKDNRVIRLIHFINDMAISENAEEVETAIESFVLPAGSSSVKETAKSYLSINSYPGILTGIEWSEFNNNGPEFQIGITAPIGIYAQLSSNFICKGTLGLFVPVIDIGAPVRLRFDNSNDTETLPDFEFKDIFSPGLYLSYGFNESPFAINAGVQYGPKLRDIMQEGEITNFDAFRFSIAFVIDIPLISLHHKPRD